MTALAVGDPYPVGAGVVRPVALDALHVGDSRVAVVTCLDLRVDPVVVLGVPRRRLDVITVHEGTSDEELDRALRASREQLGSRHVVVLAHEDCAFHGRRADDEVDSAAQAVVDRIRDAAGDGSVVLGVVLGDRGSIVIAPRPGGL